MQYRS